MNFLGRTFDRTDIKMRTVNAVDQIIPFDVTIRLLNETYTCRKPENTATEKLQQKRKKEKSND